MQQDTNINITQYENSTAVLTTLYTSVTQTYFQNYKFDFGLRCNSYIPGLDKLRKITKNTLASCFQAKTRDKWVKAIPIPKPQGQSAARYFSCPAINTMAHQGVQNYKRQI